MKQANGAGVDLRLILLRGPGYLSRYSDLLRAGRSGDRIPVGARFSAPVQTGPGPTLPPIQWVPGLSQGKAVGEWR